MGSVSVILLTRAPARVFMLRMAGMLIARKLGTENNVTVFDKINQATPLKRCEKHAAPFDGKECPACSAERELGRRAKGNRAWH